MIPACRFLSPISFSNQVFLVYLGGRLDFNSHRMYPFINNSKPLLQENGTYICFNKSYFLRWRSLGVYSSKIIFSNIFYFKTIPHHPIFSLYQHQLGSFGQNVSFSLLVMFSGRCEVFLKFP